MSMLKLPLPIPRLHLFEITDQPWFPPSLRGYVQACLTHFWTLRLRPLQAFSPATLAARKLRSILGTSISSYTFVDFCAGAGGPTPHIEREVNRSLRRDDNSRHVRLHESPANGDGSGEGVEFILTDLHPHPSAWKKASGASESGKLGYVPVPVDASRTSKEVLGLARMGERSGTWDPKSAKHERKMFRLFSLAFHHFDDELAVDILRNTLQTSDGFAIVELQARDAGHIFNILCMFPLLIGASWWWFWGQWDLLFWTYAIPVVPFVVSFDGIISCLRTRRPNEVMALLEKASADVEGGVGGWRFDVGEELHTWPMGTISYFIGVKDAN